MVREDDEVTMKKPHPCGGTRWVVVRTGADVKLRCTTCGRFVTLTRDELKKRSKTIREAEKGRQDG